MANIHENIHTFRKQKKMTLEELGNKIGTTKQTIKRYESGEIKSIPYDKIVDLANALDTTPAYLMGWTDEPLVEVVQNENLANLLVAYTEREYFDKLKNLPTEYKEAIFRQIDYFSELSNKKGD